VLDEPREHAVVGDLEHGMAPRRVLVGLGQRERELPDRFGRAPAGKRHGRNDKRGGVMAKTIRDLMSKQPCAIDADKPVAYAAKMMRDEDVGLAPIVEGQKLIGTITDRDIAIRVVAEGKDPQSTIV